MQALKKYLHVTTNVKKATGNSTQHPLEALGDLKTATAF
jgi:hypothetical protein